MANTYSLKPIDCCPEIIRGMIRERQRRIREDGSPSDSDRAFIRLCCLEEMRSIWVHLIKGAGSDGDLTAIVGTLSQKTSDKDREEFEKKTDPERLEWLSMTRNALTRLLSLMDQAPPWLDTTPLGRSPDWLAREFVGMATDIWKRQDRTNARSPPNDALAEAKRFSHLYYNYWGPPPWGLRDIAARVLRDLDAGILGTMTIRKPRDQSGARAAYILRITYFLEETYGIRLTNEEVATVTRVAFDIPTATAAIASKYRFRKNMYRMLGAIQHSPDKPENVG